MERDGYDDRAIQVIGWDGQVPMSTGRVVLPPGLPTEEACGIVVEPRGEVVDVGRMCVARSHQSLEHAAFIGLMCRLYQAMRENGFGVACGMMSAPARSLVGLLGLRLEILGPPRAHWNEPRVPVRFSLMSAAKLLAARAGQPADPPAAEDQRGIRAAEAKGIGQRIARLPAGRGSSWTTSRPMSGPMVRRPATGGTTRSRREIRLTIASTAPEPPTMCPVEPLTAITGGHESPNTVRSAAASARSLSTVLVPWALTCAISPGPTPASARARAMHRTAPSPPGLGATRWWASAVEACPRMRPSGSGPDAGDVLEPLEHDEPGSLAHDEPVAVRVEGAGGQPGERHVPAHRVQPDEAAHRAVADQGVHPARQHQVGRPPAQQFGALAEGGRAGRAGRGHGHARPLEPEPE